MSKKSQHIYKVIFTNDEDIYEIYAKSVSESEMFSFIEVGEIVFGETSSVLIDPVQEKLKSEFAGVERFYIPAHAVIRIDEVKREGVAKIHHVGEKNDKTSRVAHFVPKGSSHEPN